MRINLSRATYSSIVGIGQKIRKVSKETGQKFIELNRGVNAVTEIDLSNIIPQINFNSKEIQVYASNLGIESLRKSILKEYFPSQGNFENICVSPGGMSAIDLAIQILNVENIYFPHFYWGSYSKMATIRNKSFSFYESLSEFDLTKVNESSCIFICDPNNPTGIKMDDDYLFEMIKNISETGAIIIFDSPYRKLFYRENDRFFDKISHFENIIITESFSKWIGLSGIRIGFIWSSNKNFNDELNIRMLYEFNGVSSVSQMIVDKVISTEEGKKSIKDFQTETTNHIKLNIQYLKENNLLVGEIYNNDIPIGIFAVINRSEDFLFKHQIGAVGMDKFVYHNKDMYSDYSRICVSVRNDIFIKFISKIL